LRGNKNDLLDLVDAKILALLHHLLKKFDIHMLATIYDFVHPSHKSFNFIERQAQAF
jgi:hypothetical protein